MTRTKVPDRSIFRHPLDRVFQLAVHYDPVGLAMSIGGMAWREAEPTLLRLNHLYSRGRIRIERINGSMLCALRCRPGRHEEAQRLWRSAQKGP